LRAELRLLPGSVRSQAGIVRAVEALAPGSKVIRLSTLYHPYYAYALLRTDGSRRQELLDGLTGDLKQLSTD
jgi:hypothetical protein